MASQTMRILHTITLDHPHRGPRRTQHARHGVNVTDRVAEVRLAQFDGCEGTYILYYDSDGIELNDIYYESFERARAHIEWEFGLDLSNLKEAGAPIKGPGKGDKSI
jgi:hypothetical protein